MFIIIQRDDNKQENVKSFRENTDTVFKHLQGNIQGLNKAIEASLFK